MQPGTLLVPGMIHTCRYSRCVHFEFFLRDDDNNDDNDDNHNNDIDNNDDNSDNFDDDDNDDNDDVKVAEGWGINKVEASC